MARTHPSPIDLVIALSGGLAAAYALTRPNISAALPGVAIATALMPPLCTIGIGIALHQAVVRGLKPGGFFVLEAFTPPVSPGRRLWSGLWALKRPNKISFLA